MIAWGRSAVALLCALTLFGSGATQLVAALLDDHPSLGEGLAQIGGIRLYAPWDLLRWAATWALHAPWLALLMVVTVGALGLAALAIAALVASFEPSSFVLRRVQKGFARWDMLSQSGLLGGEGLALGAVRRHALANIDIVRHERGHRLFLGDPKMTDDALIAAISAWDGALVFVDGRDLSNCLPRSDVVRFAPGRADSIALNPLFAIRGGAHAWSDARRLASTFLQTNDVTLIDSFAVLMLDTLATAPITARTLSGLRQRLADPQRLFAETCARWGDGACDAGPATGEMTRVVRAWRRHGEEALRIFTSIDTALRLFADGDYALATEAHQLRFIDLVAREGSGTLIMAPPAGDAARAASLVSALLAQLVAACGASADLDHYGRKKRRRLLVVIEADALAALAVATKGTAPVFGALMYTAQACGCEFLIQAQCASDALALLGATGKEGAAAWRAAFSAVAAIGPQTQGSAKTLSELAGEVDFWNRRRTFRASWKDWLLPRWERARTSIVSAEMLRAAAPEDELLLLQGCRPIRCAPLVGGEGRPVFLSPDTLPPAQHDWTAPPLVKSAAPMLAATASPGPDSAPSPTVVGSRIRRALTRKAAPRLKSEGERLL